jgi:hypothetical protein
MADKMWTDKELLKKYRKFHKHPDYLVLELGDEILYELCRKHPKHNKKKEIVAKLWLIGSAYKAPIERFKRKRKENFDYEVAAKQIKRFRFDEKIKNISEGSILNKDNIKAICEAHNHLTCKFRKLTHHDNRSLASKYLHFHRSIVPLYDSRAQKGLTELFRRWQFHKTSDKKAVVESLERLRGDTKYVSFVKKIFQFQCFLRRNMRRNKRKLYTMRKIDRYLFAVADGE